MNTNKDKTISDIAAAIGVQTLQSRNSDRLDFYDLSVNQVNAALDAAYIAGYADGHARAASLMHRKTTDAGPL